MVDRSVQMVEGELNRKNQGENAVRGQACYLRLRCSLARSMLAGTTILPFYPMSDRHQFSPNNISS